MIRSTARKITMDLKHRLPRSQPRSPLCNPRRAAFGRTGSSSHASRARPSIQTEATHRFRATAQTSTTSRNFDTPLVTPAQAGVQRLCSRCCPRKSLAGFSTRTTTGPRTATGRRRSSAADSSSVDPPYPSFARTTDLRDRSRRLRSSSAVQPRLSSSRNSIRAALAREI
jgi:hypothetical protein